MYLALRPEDLSLTPATAQALLRPAGDALDAALPYLTGEHLALLLLGHDAGRLPAADQLRASRDISALQHALADLDSAQLLQAQEGDARWWVLRPALQRALRQRLIQHWEARGQAAWERLRGATWEQGARPQSELYQWMRDLLVFVAHRGVRVTSTGELHKGDLRRYASAREFPDQDLLRTSYAVGVGLGLLFPLGERLLIGECIDVLDLPPQELARRALEGWVQGTVHDQLAPLCSLGGLLSAWVEPLEQALEKPQAWQHGGDSAELVRACLGPVPGEPASHLLGEARHFDLKAAAALFAQGHRRLRASLAAWIGALPRGVALDPAALQELTLARVALEQLRRPTWVPRRKGPPAALFAQATWLLPALAQRAEAALLPWLERMLAPHGLWAAGEGKVALHPATPTGPLPPGAHEMHGLAADGTWSLPEPVQEADPGPHRKERIILQPNGDALAPPGVPIHALVHLAMGARPTSLGTVAQLTMDQRSLMRLVDASLDPRVWGQTLAEMMGAPLSPVLVEMIDAVARRHGELTLAPVGGVLVARDPVRLKELLSYKRFARHVVMQPTDTMVILEPGCDLGLLVDAIGDQGFSGILVDHPSKMEGAS